MDISHGDATPLVSVRRTQCAYDLRAPRPTTTTSACCRRLIHACDSLPPRRRRRRRVVITTLRSVHFPATDDLLDIFDRPIFRPIAYVAGTLCKNILISTDVLWQVFRIPYTHVSVNRRNSEARAHTAIRMYINNKHYLRDYCTKFTKFL